MGGLRYRCEESTETPGSLHSLSRSRMHLRQSTKAEDPPSILTGVTKLENKIRSHRYRLTFSKRFAFMSDMTP